MTLAPPPDAAGGAAPTAQQALARVAQALEIEGIAFEEDVLRSAFHDPADPVPEPADRG